MNSVIARRASLAESSGRGPDPRGASRDENPGLGRGPSGGHVQIDRGLRPSNPEKTPDHRDEAGPSKPPRTVVESNNLHATCSGFSPHTNNRLSTRTREWAVLAPRKPLEVAEADQL